MANKNKFTLIILLLSPKNWWTLFSYVFIYALLLSLKIFIIAYIILQTILVCVNPQEANTMKECCWCTGCMTSSKFIRLCMGISNSTFITKNNKIKELWLAWSVVCVFLALWWRLQAISTILSPSDFPLYKNILSVLQCLLYCHTFFKWANRVTVFVLCQVSILKLTIYRLLS